MVKITCWYLQGRRLFQVFLSVHFPILCKDIRCFLNLTKHACFQINSLLPLPVQKSWSHHWADKRTIIFYPIHWRKKEESLYHPRISLFPFLKRWFVWDNHCDASLPWIKKKKVVSEFSVIIWNSAFQTLSCVQIT